MKKKIFSILNISLFLILVGCGASNTFEDDDVLRVGYDTPEKFRPPSGVVLSGESCKNPMIDPRNGLSLTMVRSTSAGFADYEVPNQRYGVSKEELLRLNCATGEVVGVVRR